MLGWDSEMSRPGSRGALASCTVGWLAEKWIENQLVHSQLRSQQLAQPAAQLDEQPDELSEARLRLYG